MPVWRLRVFSLWLPVVFWCAVIFYFSSIPGLAGPWDEWDFFLRKAAHVTEYAILAFLVLRAFQEYPRIKAGSYAPGKILWAFLLSLLYAAGDEFHQSFVPERVASFIDVVIDSVGCSLGVFLRNKYEDMSTSSRGGSA